MTTEGTVRPCRIAVLGGGLGSMVTAFELTDPQNHPDWQERYQVTVYQLGWRLGGKGASGRGKHGRIEEHGLHVFFGFYDHAFNVMKRCYRELGRQPGQPLATWQEAFKEQAWAVVEEKTPEGWKPWPFYFKPNSLEPGEITGPSLIWENVVHLLEWMLTHFYEVKETTESLNETDHLARWGPKAWLHGLSHRLGISIDEAKMSIGEASILTAVELARKAGEDVHLHTAESHFAIARALEGFIEWLSDRIKEVADIADALRRLWIVMDLGATVVKGLLLDGVLFHERGIDSLHEDFRAWLTRHGGSVEAVESAPIRGFYDAVFAYIGGDVKNPSIEAGIFMKAAFGVMFDYKGSIFWKMQAGMGDVIFAPLYEVLKRRGVEFKFFHNVNTLTLSDDKQSVSAIEMGRQVNLKDREREYQPLVEVKGLPCWPSHPLYEQIVEGDQLQKDSIDLESFWTPWQDVATETLKAGEDFDIIVLGISLASLPYICGELIDANASWKQMVEQVQTTRTQAAQLWLEPDLEALGWSLPSAILDAYAEPLDTWADMSQLIDVEDWPEQDAPKNISYFCGPMMGGIPPASSHDTPQIASDEVRQTAITWLENHAGTLWPAVATSGNLTGFNWEQLVDPDGGNGSERFDSQYWKANIDPSQRYVLSVAFSSQHRLKTDDAGFHNLYLVGDWIDTGLNLGCAEAASMSGFQAAHAIHRELNGGTGGGPTSER